MRIRRREALIAGVAAALVPAASQARQRGGLARASGGVTSVPPPVAGPWVTGFTPGPTRNNAYLGGIAVSVPAPITITALGRMMLAGNTGSHDLMIADATNGYAILDGSTVTVNTSGQTVGQFVYANLSSPIILWPGNTYYILTAEGGDYYYDPSTTVTTTTDATALGSCFIYSGVPGTTGTIYQASPPKYCFNGPVNFKYFITNIGKTAAPGRLWSPFGMEADRLFITTIPNVVSGIITVEGVWSHGNSIPSNTITYQYFLDGAPYSPVLTNTDSGDAQNRLPWTGFNTALVPNGTHHLFPRIYDNTLGGSYYNFRCGGHSFIIANGGTFNNGPQTIPTAHAGGVKNTGPVPDYIDYTGVPSPTHTPHPISYTLIRGANDPLSEYYADPTGLRNYGHWYAEFWSGSRDAEYWHVAQLATTKAGPGGVLVDWVDAQYGADLHAAYEQVVQTNPFDGSRLNNMITAYTTYVEDPAGAGKWWSVELSGRVFTLDHDGTVTTIVGRTRDKAQLTYVGGTADDVENDKMITIGNFPPGVNLGGVNDICFDPRDSNIFYVVTPVDNWIAIINIAAIASGPLSPRAAKTVTIYAGLPEAADAYVDGTPGSGGTARFASPVSIIMDSSGTMYVADQNNNAIRKIPSSAVGSPGNVTTLCGGTVAPSLITDEWFARTTYNVSSIIWTPGVNGGTGAVVMSGASTQIRLGFTLALAGAINNAGGSGDPNTSSGNRTPSYIVTAFSDSTHFTVSFEQTTGGNGFNPTIGSGPLGGTMTFTSLNVDVYSQPTATAFASTWTPGPMSLRFTSPGPSGGNIVLGEMGTSTARLINLNSSQGIAGTIHRITSFNAHIQPVGGGWLQLDCDWAGTCGPVNDVIIAEFQDGLTAAHTIWRSSLAQSQSPSIGIGAYQGIFAFDGNVLPNYGPATVIESGQGHYPWAIAMSRTQGRMITNGTAGLHPTAWRVKQPSDPDVGAQGPNLANGSDDPVWSLGTSICASGTANGFPAELRPAFWAIWGARGYNFIRNDTVNGLNTFEDLNAFYPVDADLAAYIQSGMGGHFPRPEITGNDLRNFIYFIRRGTVAGSLGPTPVQPAAKAADTGVPMILTMTAVRDSNTQITVSWTTDKPTVGIACAATPNQPAGVYPMYSGLSAPGSGLGYATTHSAAVPVLSKISPFFLTPVKYVVTVKDVAGNFSYSVEQTIA